jgi:hypothetical protein
MNVSQFAMQGMDMHSASCGTVATSSEGAMPQTKQMATIAAGVRLHQCHITGLSETAIQECFSICNAKH